MVLPKRFKILGSLADSMIKSRFVQREIASVLRGRRGIVVGFVHPEEMKYREGIKGTRVRRY